MEEKVVRTIRDNSILFKESLVSVFKQKGWDDIEANKAAELMLERCMPKNYVESAVLPDN